MILKKIPLCICEVPHSTDYSPFCSLSYKVLYYYINLLLNWHRQRRTTLFPCCDDADNIYIIVSPQSQYAIQSAVLYILKNALVALGENVYTKRSVYSKHISSSYKDTYDPFLNSTAVEHTRHEICISHETRTRTRGCFLETDPAPAACFYTI